MIDQSDIDYFMRRKASLRLERSSFDAHWMDIARFVSPRQSRFFTTDRNKGDKRYQAIINSHATKALRTSRAGMLAGVMSPSRPWMTLETPDPDLMTYAPVADWLYSVEQLMFLIFSSSNLYTMAPTLLSELLLFGTGAMTQIEDFKDVTRFYTHTVGSYSVAQNERFDVDTIVREYELTVDQVMGIANRNGGTVSQTVQNLYDRGSKDAWVPVIHFVEPNPRANPRSPFSKDKAWRSIQFEPAARTGGKFLSERGYEEFPTHVPRWDVTGEDVYATDCPGMTTLGDVKGLQIAERRSAQAIDKMVDPPLHGPATLKNVRVSGMPGGLTAYDGDGGEHKLAPVYQVNLRVDELEKKIERMERRIDGNFYVDLFRSIENMEGIQPQNQLYLNMKRAEDLLQLGPVLERLHGEFLNKMVDRTFNMCLRANLLPPAPQELQGQPLRAKYISALAMAQREVATVGIDKLTMFVGGLIKMGMAGAADKLDTNEAINQYGRAIGTSPRLLVDDATVEKIQQTRQQQANMAHAAELASTASQAVNNLANSPTANGGNALSNVAQAAQGAQPPPTASPG